MLKSWFSLWTRPSCVITQTFRFSTIFISFNYPMKLFNLLTLNCFNPFHSLILFLLFNTHFVDWQHSGWPLSSSRGNLSQEAHIIWCSTLGPHQRILLKGSVKATSHQNTRRWHSYTSFLELLFKEAWARHHGVNLVHAESIDPLFHIQLAWGWEKHRGLDNARSAEDHAEAEWSSRLL